MSNPYAGGKTGSRVSGATLNESLVRNIRKLAAQGHTPQTMSDAYGLSVETIRRVIRRDTWKWVSDVVDYDLPPVMPSSPSLDAAAKASEERFKKMMEEKGLVVDKALEEVGKPPEWRPPPSLLDGGDAPSESDGSGLKSVQERAAAYGLDMDKQLELKK